MEQHDLIVVTPVYEDVEACSRLFKELADQFDDRLFVVAVDDGSVRQPLDVGCLEAAGVKGVVIKLKRNVGHQKAIAIGLSYVSDKIGPDQRVVVMDSDGEDLPATIPTLLKQLQRDDVDVAVAHRKSRVADCVVLKKDRLDELEWLPETCAYRLRAAGKPLAECEVFAEL